MIGEALRNGEAEPRPASQILRSEPAQGLTTVLNYQTVGEVKYFDAAGFEGRTVGLRVK